MKRLAIISALLLFASPASAVLICGNDDQQHGIWHTGELPTSLQSVDTSSTGLWCDATGDELSYIKHNFSGLRMRLGPDLSGVTQGSWQGDDAAFIINNL